MLNNNVSRETSLINVDQSMGEVILSQETVSREEAIPGQALQKIIDPMRNGAHPLIHIQMLEDSSFSDEEKEELMSAYSMEITRFEDVVKEELPVIGMVIFQHPGFNGKDGFFHPEGYYQVRILAIRNGELCLIASSSIALAMNVSYILKNPKKGWWKFPKPIVYRFSKDRNNVHHIQNCLSRLVDSFLVKKEEEK